MEIKTYLNILARRWWVVLLVTLFVGAVAIYFSPLIPPKYQAETSLRVITPLGGSLGDVTYQTYYADRLMNTYAQFATDETVLAEAKAKLGLSKQPNVTVKTIPSSEIIVISVSASDPVLAAKFANTLAEAITIQNQSSTGLDETSSNELKILSDRQAQIQNELAHAKQDYDHQVQLNAQTTAQMGIINRAIQMKENNYQNLQDQYQRAVINEAVAIYISTKVPAQTTQKILQDNMALIDTDLASLRQQYLDLSTKSVTYTQQIISSGQNVQNKAGALQALISQIDSARIANSKHESAQGVTIAIPAVPPQNPSGVSSTLVIVLGFICGLIGGILLAFLIDMLDTRIYSTEQIQRLTELPILGSLPTIGFKDRRAPWHSRDLNIQRAIGMLCSRILDIQYNRPIKKVLLTSPNPLEGKSLITLSIAEGMARSNRTVLVVDTDWRKSGLHELLGSTPSQNNLLSLLRGECQFEDAIQVFSNPRIHFLLSGNVDEDQSQLFHKAAFADLLQKLDSYDLVLFDSPSMLAVPDAYSLVAKMDGIILVVQRKRTRVEDLEVMISQLENVHSKMLGTIANKVPIRRVSDYYQRRKLAIPKVISKPV